MARPPFNNRPVTPVSALPDGMIVYNNQPVIGVVIVDPGQTLYNNQPVLGVVANEGLNHMSVGMSPNPAVEGQAFTLSFNVAPDTVTASQNGVDLVLTGTGQTRTGTAGSGAITVLATKADFPNLSRVFNAVRPANPQAIFTRTVDDIAVQNAGAFPEFSFTRSIAGISASEVA